MADLPPAVRLHHRGHGLPVHDLVVLGYDDRFLRRRRLVTVHDEGFLVSLAEVTSLSHGDAFELQDGKVIEVIAAEEPLAEVRGPRLPLLAWHIGNRHTPCQIDSDRLLIRQDHVLEAMLRGLGADVRHVSEPFVPEGGAYGMGRTLGHDHGHGTRDHGHDHDHGHDRSEPGHDHDRAARHPVVVTRSLHRHSGPVDHELPDEGPFGPE
jgi:urease accessory protein